MTEERKFANGDTVRKAKGSSWQGKVVGFYSTDLTPVGYAVESTRETGSVQIYPEAALELVELCPVCLEALADEDICSTDIELGTCHAECLEGSPTVNLDTGEPMDGPIHTYRFGDLLPAPAPPQTPTPVSLSGGWQGIVTAPKDGSDLLLSATNWHGDVVVGCWSFDGWRDRDCSDKLEPTHWMPLPLPPALAATSEGSE